MFKVSCLAALFGGFGGLYGFGFLFSGFRAIYYHGGVSVSIKSQKQQLFSSYNSAPKSVVEVDVVL